MAKRLINGNIDYFDTKEAKRKKMTVFYCNVTHFF